MNSGTDLKSLCRRLEYAQAAQNQAMAQAQGRMHPGTGARCERIGGAFAVFLGPGHMLNQGLALGLDGPIQEEDLDAIEAVIGSPSVLELSAGADPDTYPLLAQRGYRLQAFQQVWMRSLEEAPSPAGGGLLVRPIEPVEAERFVRVVVAGFFGQDELKNEGLDIFLPATQAAGTTCFLAWMEGEPVGAGTLSISDGVATLSGTSVRPRFRGRGAQGALIQARLAFARGQGCATACSASVPHGPSQFNLQRQGFRVAYPKLEMIRD